MTNKKLMIIVTPEMELLLNRVKKEIFPPVRLQYG